MSNYNEVADRLDNERLSVSLGDRQLAARVLRSVATLESQLAAKTAECERVTRKLNFLETEGDEKDGWCEHERRYQCTNGEHDHCYLCELEDVKAECDTALADLATTKSERDQAIESIRQCRVFLRGCMNHAYDETPIVEVAKDVSAEFHRNRYQLQCMAKERDDIAKERDAANLLLKRLMCVVVPDNAVPNDMKEFVRDSAATVLKDLWEYLKSDTDLRMARHEVG